MEKEFVTFDIAKLMHDNGFDEACFGLYLINEVFTAKSILKEKTLKIGCVYKGYSHPDCILAPLWQQAIDWLRNVHNVNVDMYQADSGDYVYSISHTGIQNTRLSQNGNYPYPEAMEKGILKAISLINCKFLKERNVTDKSI